MFAHLVMPKAPFEVDLSVRPATVDYTPSRGLGVFFMLMGLAWCGFSALAYSENGGFFSYLMFGVLLSMGLAIFFLLGLRAFLYSRVVTFKDNGVVARERGLRGVKDWYAPYTEFEGVSHRHFARTGKHTSAQVLHIIELCHPSRLPVILRAIEDAEEPRAAVERFARALDLPIISTET